MKVFSASEAIWPALQRTYSYLFRPFKLEAFLKLAAAATISEGFVVCFKFWVPNAVPIDVDWTKLGSFLVAPAFLPVTILGAIAVFLVGVYCVYLVTRIRFGFIHCLIHQTRELRAVSNLYSAEIDRFFTASMLIWLSFLVFAVLALVLCVIAGYGVVATPTPEGKLDLDHFFLLFLPLFGIAFVLLLGVCAAQVVLNDFILPHMAIEGTTFRKAWADVRLLINANRETFASYFILRLALPVLAGAILGFVAWVLGLMVFGILDMSAAGFTAMLDGTTDVRAYLLLVIQVIFVVLGLGAGVVLAIGFGGPIGVFMRSYALFFYGGHYQALGNLLSPPTPQSLALERIAKIS